MLILGTRNNATQTTLTDGTIDLGSVYRRYCKKTCNGLPNFSTTSDAVTLNGDGIYHITAKFVVSGTAAGVATAQMFVNGQPVTGAIASETITTANTELRTMVIDEYVLVDKTCILGAYSTLPKAISFVNTGIGATYTSVVVNIDKVV